MGEIDPGSSDAEEPETAGETSPRMDDRTRKVRAREAVARLRIRETIRRRERRRELAYVLLTFGPGVLAVLALPFLGPGAYPGLNDLPNSMLVGGLWMAAIPLAIVHAFFAIVAVLVLACLLGLLALAGLGHAYLLARRVIRGGPPEDEPGSREEALELLEEEGRVDLASFGRSPDSVEILERLAEEDEGLMFDPGEGLEPAEVGPPASCPDCGAPLTAPGEGVHRCAHCGYERFEEPPARSDVLEQARRELAGDPSNDGVDLPADPWPAFRDEVAPGLVRHRTSFLLYVGTVLLAGGLADLSIHGLGRPELGQLLGLIPMLGGLPLGVLVLAAVGTWLNARLSFHAGMAAHDRALRTEIVRVVARRGRVGLDDLADHLGPDRSHLEEVLVGLRDIGGIPLFRDRERDELIGLHALAMGENECPACAGRLEVAPGSRIVCDHCGSEAYAPLERPGRA